MKRFFCYGAKICRTAVRGTQSMCVDRVWKHVSVLCPGEAEWPVLFFGRSRERPCGLARFSLSLEQILFYPSLPTSYWRVHNGSCVSLLGSSALSNRTCWIGEFLWGTQGCKFCSNTGTTFPFLKQHRAHLKVHFLKQMKKTLQPRSNLINKQKKGFYNWYICFDVLSYKALTKQFYFFYSLVFHYPVSTLETASFSCCNNQW